MRSANRLSFLFALMIGWTSATAQTCFRGRPLEHCRSFLLTEVGARRTFTGNHAPYGTGNRTTLLVTGGWMRNIGPRTAVGGVVGVDADHDYGNPWLAMGPRFRYWFRETSLDAQATVAIHNGGARNPTLQVILMFRDTIGFDAGVVFGDTYDRAGTRPFLGVRMGSYAGSALLAVAAGIVLIAVAACSDGGCIY